MWAVLWVGHLGHIAFHINLKADGRMFSKWLAEYPKFFFFLNGRKRFISGRYEWRPASCDLIIVSIEDQGLQNICSNSCHILTPEKKRNTFRNSLSKSIWKLVGVQSGFLGWRYNHYIWVTVSLTNYWREKKKR